MVEALKRSLIRNFEFSKMHFDFSKVLLNRSKIRLYLPYRNVSLRTNSPSFNYCLELVEKKDYENFLCCLMLPTKLRQHAIALRAFNAEISIVEDQVSENITGLMRFQFWEDAINRLYEGTVPEHPICQELIKVIRTKEISKTHLLRPVLSRRKFLKQQFKSLEEAEEHSDWSISSLYYILLELHGLQNVDADHAASHLGKAQGLSIILRSVSRNSQRNVVTLPQDIMLKHKVSQEDILRNKVNVQTKDLAFDLATSIHHHLTIVKKIKSEMKRKNRCLYSPYVPIQTYLKKLRSADFNMFDPQLQQRDQWLSLRLLCRKLIS